MKYRLLILIATLLGAAAPQDPVDAVALALARGVAGEQAGDSEAMLKAAAALEDFGARPAADNPDFAKRWQTEAHRRGESRRGSGPYRGRALGPAYRSGVLRAGQSLVTEQIFLAGQTARVALVPQPSRSLALRIVTTDDIIVCDRDAAAPRAACDWLPTFTTRVRIHVVNRGSEPARFFLVSN